MEIEKAVTVGLGDQDDYIGSECSNETNVGRCLPSCDGGPGS